MTITLGAVMAEAARLWRSERGLVWPLGGVFYLVPMLGLVMLMADINLASDAGPEAMQAAITAFYQKNLVTIVAVNIAVDFGSFALLNLYLQGGGRTLGEVLALTARRFPLFMAIDILAGLLFATGLSLLVLPGLFAFARTWLAGPAIAAEPERGVIHALRQGWVRSGGLVWALILFCTTLVLLGGASAVLLSGQVIGLIAALAGGAPVFMAIAYVVLAGVGATVWTLLTLLRIAFYRLTAARRGM